MWENTVNKNTREKTRHLFAFPRSPKPRVCGGKKNPRGRGGGSSFSPDHALATRPVLIFWHTLVQVMSTLGM